MMLKWFAADILRGLAKIAGLGLLIWGVSMALGFALAGLLLPDTLVQAADQIFAPPTYNWFVCEDLGIGTIPGVPEPRQIFRLCHNQGWEIRAYCLQPGLPPPPLGTTCSHTAADTYWCGDTFQLLQAFAQDVTPTASPIPSATDTTAPSVTPQTPSPTLPTATPLTATLTPTGTELPSYTPPPTLTPRLTNSATLSPSATSTPQPSPSQTAPAATPQTPQPSLTPVEQLSPTLTSSQTAAPTDTVTTTATQPGQTLTSTPGQSATPTDTRTPGLPAPIITPRPHPGGSGNLPALALGGLSLGLLAFVLGFAGLLLLAPAKPGLRLPSWAGGQVITLGRPARFFALLALLWLVGQAGLLAVGGLPGWLAGAPDPAPARPPADQAPPAGLTATPFQPRHPTPEFAPARPAPVPVAWEFAGLDFSPQTAAWVQIVIDPPGPQVNRGQPLEVAFRPAESCNFGDQQACVSAWDGLIFLTVHSGYGGEAQRYRHALEGSGLNAAAYSLETVQANLRALQGAQVAIDAAGRQQSSLQVRAVMRIPPDRLEEYFALPVEAALELAGRINPEAWAAIDPDQPRLVFETCGWRLPGEPGAEQVSATTGSVYVTVIQPRR